MSVMTPTEVSTILGIKPSTLRKYCLLLEEQGVKFERNPNNSRKFSDMDVVTLRKMITLMNNDGVSVEDAVFAVSSWLNGDPSIMDENTDTNNAVERHNGDITAALIGEIRSLKNEVEKQKEVIDGFRLAQEKRDSYFVEILENLQGEIRQLNEQATLPEPDPSPDPQLLEEMEGLREEISHLKEVVASKEESERKKGFFARLFK